MRGHTRARLARPKRAEPHRRVLHHGFAWRNMLLHNGLDSYLFRKIFGTSHLVHAFMWLP